MADFSHCDSCQIPVRSFKSWNLQNPQAWLLPCLHVACAPCKKKLQVPTSPQKIVCPVCKTECSKNLLLLIPDSRSCLIRCETPACPEKKVATMKCFTCNELLCAECGIAHRRVTATSTHLLQPVEEIFPDHCRCLIHPNARVVCVCSCGMAACPDCLQIGIHNGQQHNLSSINQLTTAARVDEEKIKSSTAREISHIETNISILERRKRLLAEKVDLLKKEVGNNITKACNAILRRGCNLLGTLDFVKKELSESYERLSADLKLQQLRFNRINSYIDFVKDYDEPTALGLTNVYLSNCINLIKAKKVRNEKCLNALHRSPQVEMKLDFDRIIELAEHSGQILAEGPDGNMKTVEIRPQNLPPNVLNVPLFDTNKNLMLTPNVINCSPSTSAQPSAQPSAPNSTAISTNAPLVRPTFAPHHFRMFHQQQQQYRAAQEVAMRQGVHAVRHPNGVDPRLPLLSSRLRSPELLRMPARFSMPSTSCFMRPPMPVPTLGLEKCVLPNGQIVDVCPRLPASLPGAIPAAALMEPFNNPPVEIHNSNSVKLPSPRFKTPLAQTISIVSGKVINNADRKSTGVVAPATAVERVQETGAVNSGCAQTSASRTFCIPTTSLSSSKSPLVPVSSEAVMQSCAVRSEGECVDVGPDLSQTKPETAEIPLPRESTENLRNLIDKLCKPAITNTTESQPCVSGQVPALETSLDVGKHPSHTQSSTADLSSNNPLACESNTTSEDGEISPSDALNEETPAVENVISNSDPSDESSVDAQNHDLFANRTNQLLSVDEKKTNESVLVSLLKEAESAGKTPLKMVIKRDAVVNSSAACDKQGNGIEEESNENVDEFVWEDYCYVCQQGCDEKTGSLGCCAKCPRVFHNFCHIPAIKEQMEDLPDEWTCGLCVPVEPLTVDSGTMGPRERQLCSKVLLRCYQNNSNVQPFLHPVPRTHVDYHAVIKRPMDFGCIIRRLKEKAKDPFSNVTQFICSLNLVFENCSTFNPPQSEIARAGRELYQLYVKAVNEFLPCMKNLVWLYVNKYSETKIAVTVQKETGLQIPRFTRARSREAEMSNFSSKRPRRDPIQESEFEVNEFGSKRLRRDLMQEPKVV